MNFWIKVSLLVIPVYSWCRFTQIWLKLHARYNEYKLFYNRHNCVVMYDSQRGAVGWPKQTTLIPFSSCLAPTNLAESIVYFISTTKKSLDIAVMIIDIEMITSALIQAHKNGVTLRILLDYGYGSSRKQAKDLQDAGLQVQFYVCPEDICSIMHYKYMIKDRSKTNGFVYLGSLNWSSTSIRMNYEDTVFSMNRSMVDGLHNNFEEVWNYVSDLNENNLYVKAKLKKVL